MLFNSPEFAVFFIIVYGLYLFLNQQKQNRMLLAASYVFYGWWDWRFLGLIIVSTAIDYFCALRIQNSHNRRKRRFFLFISVAANLGILGFFKYFNFFAQSLSDCAALFGWHPGAVTLNIILPIGISFYTFQTMSYTIDVYRKELTATRNVLDFALYVSFFPQLVAGPIERAKHLLPQILGPRKVSTEGFSEGCFLVFWGLFQKIFIADNLASLVDPVFSSPQPGGALVLCALYAFSFQIFCDFAGYSNIARGLGRMMGFDIMVNFRIPYFSATPSEFWQRWHISLSGWLRDYLYIPLGGNRKGLWMTFRNLALTMLLGGLWHGAAWNFVLWGAYHGGLLIVYHRFETRRGANKTGGESGLARLGRVILFFHLTVLGWLFFRADSMTQIGFLLSRLLSHFATPLSILLPVISSFLFYTGVLILVQLIQYRKNDLMIMLRFPLPLRWAFYAVLLHLMLFAGNYSERPFIYFQF